MGHGGSKQGGDWSCSGSVTEDASSDEAEFTSGGECGGGSVRERRRGKGCERWRRVVGDSDAYGEGRCGLSNLRGGVWCER